MTDDGDFYLDHGNVVFTAVFLRRRGYCCESGCRHCPYQFDPARAVEKRDVDSSTAASPSSPAKIEHAAD